MSFQFNPQKATQVACMFTEKEGGEINVMKLLKLIYLLDRHSIERRGMPVVGGRYVSMKNGPLTSQVLDLINGEGRGIDQAWNEHLSDRENHCIGLVKPAPCDALSESEEGLLNEIYVLMGKKDQWQIVEWCHNHCEEWHHITDGCKDISAKRLLSAVGKDAEEIAQLLEEDAESTYLQELLS